MAGLDFFSIPCGANAFAQRVHQVHHVLAAGTRFRGEGFAGALLVDEIGEGGLVLVFELVRLEVARLLVDDVPGEIKHTGLDMRNQSLEFMQANFGKAGAYYYWISRGVDDREVRTNRIRKSVGAENTFSIDRTQFDAMAAELQPLIEKNWRHCEKKGSQGRTVTLKVKFADFELITRSRTLPASVDSCPNLEFVTLDLLRLVFPLVKAVRLLGVSVSGFVGDDGSNQSKQIALEL